MGRVLTHQVLQNINHLVQLFPYFPWGLSRLLQTRTTTNCESFTINMFFLACLVSLAITHTLAGPVSINNGKLVDRAVAKADHLAACEAAPNCETYTDDQGRERVRFKSGIEPGTSDHNQRMTRRDLSSHLFEKRVDGPMVKMTAADKNKLDAVVKADAGRHTYVTVGDTAIYWGCSVDPVQALGNLSAPCASTGACDSSSPWSLGVTYVTPTHFAETQQTLSITASGHYPPDEYDQFLQAVTTAVSGPNVVRWSRGVTVDSGDIDKRDTGPEDAPTDTITHGPTGSCDIAQFSDFISVSVYNGESLVGNIDATMSMIMNTPSFCTGAVGKVLQIGSAVAGMFPNGGPLAGTLGMVTASCS